MTSEILLASQQNPLIPVTSLFTRKELVGKGAYGGVYKGIHNPTGLVVALKVIDLDTPDDDISEIQREVALLSSMRDANRYNITLYHGCYLHGHELWIAMDFASGGSIRTLMKSGKIEEKYTVLILREVLVALAFLHRQGIIHRDVKAANILLTQVGRILLCDFGVAAHLQTNNKRSTFIGTPLWMAPEVITDGKLYDTKADIWSLGITLYEIATGNPPYFGMEPLRACALIPRTAPAKLEGGNWSTSMREFLALCLQIDPTHRPPAEDLQKAKWIKSGSKLPMALLKELIARYVHWVQAGGQRASLAGLDALTREDTFEIEEDHWDFDIDNDDMATMTVEPLWDEPYRTLDDRAATSHIRPPKQKKPVNRNHPLMRLFDAESNPYAMRPSTPIELPSGLASMDTVRPMISIPSFEEMDEMSSSTNSGNHNFMQVAEDLVSPADNRPSPFSWSAPNGNGPPPSPRLGEDAMWATSETPTEATFHAANQGQGYPPVSSSPSMPSMPFDRPFQPARRRADTAPSFEYPAPGPGIPTMPTSSHSSSTSVSSAHSVTLSAASSSSSHTTHHDSPPPNLGGPRPSFSRGRSGLDIGPDSNRPFRNPNAEQKPSSREGFVSSKNPSPSSEGPFREQDQNRPFRNGSNLDVNRPFRERKNSDATFRFQSNESDPTARPRTASGARPNGMYPPRNGIKPAQISASLGPSSSPGPNHVALPPLHRSAGSITSSNAYLLNGPPSATIRPNGHGAMSSISQQLEIGFPFPSGPIEIESADRPASSASKANPWPSGPLLQPLDYGALGTMDEIQPELERTLDELGAWLEVVDGGLSRILSGDT